MVLLKLDWFYARVQAWKHKVRRLRLRIDRILIPYENTGIVNPSTSSAVKPYPIERQDTVRATPPKSRSPSKRASVYELEAELQRVKDQNKQAMGALQMATRQINSLEARLQDVEFEDGLE